MSRRTLAAILLAAGCGLFPDPSGLSGDGGSDDARADAAADAPVEAPVEASADVANEAPPAGLQVAAVWNNIDPSDNLGPSLSVPITATAGDALLACVREGSNDTDAFTITDDKSQLWTQTKSGYESANVSSRMACFWVASTAAVSTVTVDFTTAGGVSVRSLTVLEITGADASTFEDASIGIGATTDGVNSTLQSGALTTTHANDMLVYYVGLGDNVTSWTAGTGFTIPNNAVAPGISGSNVRTAIAVENVSTTQSGVTTTMSWSPTLTAGHGEMGVFVAIRGS